MQLIGLIGNFFGGAAGGFGGGGFGAGSFNLAGGQFGAFAEGGYVTGPTNALIGEGGEPEYVIPESKMSNAMAKYSQGQRGSALLDSAAAPSEGNASSAAPTISIQTGPVMSFEGANYVSQADFQAGLAKAAMEGGKQGEARAMRQLKNSPSTRRKLGI